MVGSSPDEGADVKRRDFLAATGVLMVSPVDAFSSVALADRYAALQSLSRSAGIMSYAWRLETAKFLNQLCYEASRSNPSRDNHLLAGVAATMYALLLRSQAPSEALEIARRAGVHSVWSGRHDVQQWSAAGFAFIANYLGRHAEAITGLKQALTLSPENGTRHLFALAQLAEAYGAVGDKEMVRQSICLLENAREKVVIEDEFANFRIYDQKAHSSSAFLKSGQLTEAIRYAETL